MTLPTALVLAAIGLSLTVLFGWLGARPARSLGSPRLVPWRLMMLISFVLAIAALVHAIGLVRAR